jgi:D-sedoheptulose 7-phosphate isomerase
MAAEFVHPVIVGKRPLPALNLTAHQAIVTVLGNDVGFDLIFSRQRIPYEGIE